VLEPYASHGLCWNHLIVMACAALYAWIEEAGKGTGAALYARTEGAGAGKGTGAACLE
jgi:hypothetical protein